MKGSTPHRKPTCAIALDCNLEELRRLNDVESLRRYIIQEKCFPPQVAPNAPITIDELKKLARAWKLNERRNFWKTHNTQDALVEVLLKYVDDAILSRNKTDPSPANPPLQFTIPTPPTQEKKRISSFNSQFHCSRTGLTKFYCGHKLQNNIRNPNDILSRSRYYSFPDEVTNLHAMIGTWRIEDIQNMNHFDVSINEMPSMADTNSESPEYENDALIEAKRKDKQRVLSNHLLNYSCKLDNFTTTGKHAFTRKTAETFLNVADCDDIDVVTNCAMAISNICSRREVRQFMCDLNALHKFTAYLPFLCTSDGNMACAVFYYYMSCDAELEDRIWNAGFKAFQRTLAFDDFNLRMITLQCLSNLIPSSERLRVVELIVASLHQLYRDYGKQAWNLDIFTILLNTTTFYNTHHTLVDGDVLDLISMASGELEREDVAAGRLLAQILSNFLFSPDLADELVQADYARIFIDLLHIDDSDVMEICMHSFLVMSTIPGFVKSMCDSDIVHIVGSLVCSTAKLSDRIAEEAAGYLSNICRPTIKFSEERVKDGAAVALLTLIREYPYNIVVQKAAISGIRDLLVLPGNCVVLFNEVIPVLLQLAYDQRNNLDVIHCIHNICCAEQCTSMLIEKEIELNILELLCTNYGKFPIKCALLKVLVLLAEKGNVILKILNRGLIKALLDLVVSAPKEESLWIDVSRLLIVVIYHDPVLTEVQQSGIVQLLQAIGGKGSSEKVIINCSFILAFLSYTISDFSMVDPIIRSILSISESDSVMNAASTVLYNVACNPKDSFMLLQDGMLHINIMIRMMRGGSARVQQNIAEAMRLLCIMPRCNELLLQHDLLSDFIVIALLRTNSAEVKRVCSEAFFNMLCHNNTRKKLLKGDLWWAMMRLSKADVSSVKLVCARAVFNLASEPDNISSLRENYIFVFIKEIIYENASCEFIEIFLQVIYRIIEHSITTSTSLNHTELLSIIQIFVKCLPSTTDMISYRWLSFLLCKIAKLSLLRDGNEINEFIQINIVYNFYNSRSIWAKDMECRHHVAILLQILTSNTLFTSSTSITELVPLLTNVALGLNNSSNVLTELISENVLNCVLYYVSRGLVDTMSILTMPFLVPCIQRILSNEQEEMKASSKKDLPITPTLIILLKLLAFVSGEITTQTNREIPCDRAVEDILNVLSIRLLLQKSFLGDINTRVNVITILSNFSQSNRISINLLQYGIIEFLDIIMKDEKLKKISLLVEFCSIIPRTIAMNMNMTKVFIKAKGLETLLQRLITLSPEASSDIYKQRYAISGETILANACVVLYYISHDSLDSPDSIKPDRVLSLVTDITYLTKDRSINHVLKQIIGLVLERAQGVASFDPSFVQTIMTEINDVDKLTTAELTEFMAPRKMTALPDMTPLVLSKEEYIGTATIQSVNVEDLWSPIIMNQRKRMEYSTPSEGSVSEPNRTPVTHENNQLEMLSPLPSQQYSKMIIQYPFLTKPCTVAVNEEMAAERKLLHAVREEDESVESEKPHKIHHSRSKSSERKKREANSEHLPQISGKSPTQSGRKMLSITVDEP